jgi:hypothetical protein
MRSAILTTLLLVAPAFSGCSMQASQLRLADGNELALTEAGQKSTVLIRINAALNGKQFEHPSDAFEFGLGNASLDEALKPLTPSFFQTEKQNPHATKRS